MMSRRLWTYLCRRGGGITLAQGQAPAHPTLLTQRLPCDSRGQPEWAACNGLHRLTSCITNFLTLLHL